MPSSFTLGSAFFQPPLNSKLDGSLLGTRCAQDSKSRFGTLWHGSRKKQRRHCRAIPYSHFCAGLRNSRTEKKRNPSFSVMFCLCRGGQSWKRKANSAWLDQSRHYLPSAPNTFQSTWEKLMLGNPFVYIFLKNSQQVRRTCLICAL